MPVHRGGKRSISPQKSPIFSFAARKNLSDSSIYPNLADVADSPIVRFCEEQEEEDDSFVAPFDKNTSIAASSTPILATELFHRNKGNARNSDSVLAGNLPRLDEVIDHTSTNSSFSRSSDDGFPLIQDVIDGVRSAYNFGGIKLIFEKHGKSFLLALILCLLLIIGVKVFTVFPSEVERAENYQQFKRELRTLKNKFPSLTKSDWHTLVVFGQQWIADDSEEPVVLTVGGKNAEKFVNSLNSIIRNISFIERSPLLVTLSVDRSQLHEKLLQDLLLSSNLRSTTVLGIENLSWDAPLALHAFCDSDFSPVPDSALIFTVNETIEKEDCEESLSSVLTNMWTSSGGINDSVSPILSRVLTFTICV